MGKLILVTGGARSGKSSFAEETAKAFGKDILYIATSIPFDEEMRLRIQKHREQRPSHWETVEAHKDFAKHLEGRLSDKAAGMLDCITIMVSNLMFERNVDWLKLTSGDMVEIEEAVKVEIDKLLALLKGAAIPFILVTNELGMGVVPENALARLFRDIAGRVNQQIAKAADEVYFCVSGIPMKIKG